MTQAAAARKFISDFTEDTLTIDRLWAAKQIGDERDIAEARDRVILNDLGLVYYVVFEEKP